MGFLAMALTPGLEACLESHVIICHIYRTSHVRWDVQQMSQVIGEFKGMWCEARPCGGRGHIVRTWWMSAGITPCADTCVWRVYKVINAYLWLATQ